MRCTLASCQTLNPLTAPRRRSPHTSQQSSSAAHFSSFSNTDSHARHPLNMFSMMTRSLTSLLALATLLLVSSSSASAQHASSSSSSALPSLSSSSSSSASSSLAVCYPCEVDACQANFTAPLVSLSAPTLDAAARRCIALNQDIMDVVFTAQNDTCGVTVGTFFCDVIAIANETQVGCDQSTIGLGTPYGNATYFQQQCEPAVPCLGFLEQDTIIEGGACSAIDQFVATITAVVSPSDIPCALCNITACYGLASNDTGVTDVTFFTGSLPGYNGVDSCAAQQAVAANLLASGKVGAPLADVQAAVCDPQALLVLYDSEAMCNAGEEEELLTELLFEVSAAQNVTWEEFCSVFIPEVFNPTVAGQLIASGYCINPAVGLTQYALQFVLPATPTGSAPSASSSSSSSSALPSLSSSSAPIASSSSAAVVPSSSSLLTAASPSAASTAAPAVSSSAGGIAVTSTSTATASPAVSSTTAPVATSTSSTAPPAATVTSAPGAASSATTTPPVRSSSAATTPSASSSTTVAPVLASSAAAHGGGGTTRTNSAVGDAHVIGVVVALLLATMALLL